MFKFRISTAWVAVVCASLAVPAFADVPSGAYLAARSAAGTGNFDAAARYFTQALARDPSNPEILENAAVSMLALGDFDRAAAIARKLDDDGLVSQVAQIILLSKQANEGGFDGIIADIEGEKGVGPLVDGLMVAWAHVGKGDMSAALAGFDAVAAQRGMLGFALYHKGLALALVGDLEAAEQIFSSPQAGSLRETRRGAIAHIEILSLLGRKDDALALMAKSFGGELDPKLRQMQTALMNGDTLTFSHVTSAKDGMAEVFFTVASALRNEASEDYTILYSRVAEYLRPDHVDALLLTAGLLEQLKQFELATQTYKKVSASDPAFHAAELGRADALRRSGKPDAAIEVLQKLTETHGDLAVVHSSLGDSLRQLERFEEAVASYDKALSLYAKPDLSQWVIHYARGISYERLDDWDKSEADFRAALVLNPDQPQVLNYLGYSLVEKQVKLDEALAMIQRAVAISPDSGYIVDSLGWVLYRLGRYSEAVVHMERAAELMPVDPVVNDHLGDVYWAVGRKLEAEFQWRRALSFVDLEDAAGEADPDRIRSKLDIGLDAVLSAEGSEPLKVANDD